MKQRSQSGELGVRLVNSDMETGVVLQHHWGSVAGVEQDWKLEREKKFEKKKKNGVEQAGGWVSGGGGGEVRGWIDLDYEAPSAVVVTVFVGFFPPLSEMREYFRVLSQGVILSESCFKKLIMAAVWRQGSYLETYPPQPPHL